MDRDYEAEAKKDGWMPKDDFKGEPEMWKEAQQFVEDGEQILPIVKGNLKKQLEKTELLETQLRDTNTKIDKMGQTFSEFNQYHTQTVQKAEERSYKKAIGDIEAKQRAAVEERNTDEFDALAKEKLRLQNEKIDANVQLAQQHQNQQAPIPTPEAVDWEKNNSWYRTDLEMTAFVDSISPYIYNENPGFPPPPAKFFKRLSDEAKKKFPDKFEPPTSNQRVEGDTSEKGVSKGGNGRGYNDLPAEAKKICDRFVDEKLLDKKQFLKDYDWELAATE